MSDHSLMSWIDEVRATLNLTDAQIRVKLLGAGWGSVVVDDAINESRDTSQVIVNNQPNSFIGNASLAQDTRPVQSPTQVMPVSVVLANPNTESKSNTLFCHDKEVIVSFEIKNPHVVVVNEFLTPEECAKIIEMATPALSRSTVVQSGTGGSVVDPIRTSDGMFFAKKQDEFITRIENRLSAFVNWPIENGEGMQVLRYSPGAEYKPHNDYFNVNDDSSKVTLKRGGQRIATVIVYLNEVAAGGGTIFPDLGLEVKPVPGSAIFFGYPTADNSSKTLHGGCPVVTGEKWVLVKWFREDVFI